MDDDVLFFFNQRPKALPLYAAFERRVLAEIEEVSIKAHKTQISFSNKHGFAFVSFAPVRRAKERPGIYIVVSFGLGRRASSPRIDAATEPYPGRWTHHVLISDDSEIDDELMAWVREAAEFSANK